MPIITLELHLLMNNGRIVMNTHSMPCPILTVIENWAWHRVCIHCPFTEQVGSVNGQIHKKGSIWMCILYMYIPIKAHVLVNI